MRPNKEDHIPYFEYYISMVPENDIVSALINNKIAITTIISQIPESKGNFAYSDGKWTVKHLLNHIIDTERIFCYRALRFARGDAQMLRSYDENLYAANASLDNTTLEMQLQEFSAVRDASILFYKQLTEKQLKLKGILESGETTVLSLGYVICGHATHHIKVLNERYFSVTKI